jgi:hypothetical protein
MRGGVGLNEGLNQTIDFIFYNDQKEVLLQENKNVSNGNNYAFLGTFAAATIGGLLKNKLSIVNKVKIMHGETVPLTISEATERAKAILRNDLGLDESMADQIVESGNIRELGGEGKFFNVTNDKRLDEEDCIPDKCEIKTQLFAIHVDGDKSNDLAKTYKTKESKWVSYDSVGENIFEGHRLLLSKVKGELFETSEGGRRRTRKHKKGKKSKKSKKAKKHRKGKKTYKRRH